MTQFAGTLYPDRTFSLGRVPKRKKSREDSVYDREHANQSEVDYLAVSDWLTGSTSILGEFRSTSEAALFIKAPKSSREFKGRYGSHGITGFGRKFVRNTSLLLERKFGRKQLGFVTCTMPDFPKAVFKRLIGIWNEVVRRFYQKLRRQLEKQSVKFTYCGVTEIQEKRFKNGGLPAPHLHFVYVCRRSIKERYYLYVCQIHRAWNEALREGIALCGYPHTMSSLPGWGSVHCKTVRKSASAYLGKYMSKGTKVLEEMKEAGYDEFPKQWWTASLDAKAMFKKSLIHLDSHTCSSFLYNFEDYLHEGTIVWGNFVYADIGGQEVVIGLVGTLSVEAYKLLSG